MQNISNAIPIMLINQVLILNAKYFKRDICHVNESSIDVECSRLQTWYWPNYAYNLHILTIILFAIQTKYYSFHFIRFNCFSLSIYLQNLIFRLMFSQWFVAFSTLTILSGGREGVEAVKSPDSYLSIYFLLILFLLYTPYLPIYLYLPIFVELII